MNEWLERHRGYLIVVLLNFIGWAAVFFALHRPTQGLVEILPPPTTTPAPTSTPIVLTVYVSGAVANPDVYTLPAGSRVKQAVEAAGGFAEDAVEAGVNLAQTLVDGQQVYVPRQSEVADVPAVVAGSFANASSVGESNRPININLASVEELTALPGIGPSIAGRIVQYRDSHGPYRTIEEIKKVKGIGDAIFEKIKDRITVN